MSARRRRTGRSQGCGQCLFAKRLFLPELRPFHMMWGMKGEASQDVLVSEPVTSEAQLDELV